MKKIVFILVALCAFSFNSANAQKILLYNGDAINLNVNVLDLADSAAFSKIKVEATVTTQESGSYNSEVIMSNIPVYPGIKMTINFFRSKSETTILDCWLDADNIAVKALFLDNFFLRFQGLTLNLKEFARNKELAGSTYRLYYAMKDFPGNWEIIKDNKKLSKKEKTKIFKKI